MKWQKHVFTDERHELQKTNESEVEWLSTLGTDRNVVSPSWKCIHRTSTLVVCFSHTSRDLIVCIGTEE